MTKSIDAITCYVRESLLKKNDSKELLKAKIVSVQAYKGYELTFQILIQNQFLYSNILTSELVLRNNLKDFLVDNNSVYNFCPKDEIDVYVIDYCIGREIGFKNNKSFIKGDYICSIDFYTGNEQLHLISANNRLWFIPNHKINWSGENNFPDFKKL